jgi:hypothetical protein
MDLELESLMGPLLNGVHSSGTNDYGGVARIPHLIKVIVEDMIRTLNLQKDLEKLWHCRNYNNWS